MHVTFRQILNILWRRRWLITAVVVIAVGVAVVFLQRQVPLYSSTATLRFSAAATDASLSGQLGTVPVDFEPDTITSPAVLEPAAKLAGEPADALLGAVTVAT